jgi:hypothetical protein
MWKDSCKVIIQTPCEEKWHNMLPDAQGRSCLRCAKKVIDFTPLTDAEIIEWINRSQGNLCGRFNKEQLNRSLTARSYATSHTKLHRVVAGILLVSTLKLLSAERPPVQTTGNTNYKGYKLHDRDSYSYLPSDSLKKVQGRVLNSVSKAPVANAEVHGSLNQVAKTDTTGYFELTMHSALLEDTIELYVTHAEFQYSSLIIMKDDLAKVQTFYIHPHTEQMLGAMQVVRKKWWQFWR